MVSWTLVEMLFVIDLWQMRESPPFSLLKLNSETQNLDCKHQKFRTTELHQAFRPLQSKKPLYKSSTGVKHRDSRATVGRSITHSCLRDQGFQIFILDSLSITLT